MRLLAVELARLRSRRAYWFIVLLALGAALLAVGTTVNGDRPPSAAAIAEADRQVAQERQQDFYQDELERCEESQAEGGTGEYGPGFDCDQVLPQRDWFLYYDAPRFVDDVRDMVPSLALMLALAGALVGATFVGAEWSAGTIGTHLLFEPRRGRVYASKAAAAAIGMTVPAVVGLGVVIGGLYWSSSMWGSTELVSTDDMGAQVSYGAGQIALLGGRGVLYVAAAAVGGYLLAMAFRSSLAAVGAVAGYALAGEGLLRIVWSGAESWLVSNRSAAWLFGGHSIYDYDETECINGMCEPDVTTISTLAGGLYLAIMLAIGLAVSYGLFRRRDVT